MALTAKNVKVQTSTRQGVKAQAFKPIKTVTRTKVQAASSSFAGQAVSAVSVASNVRMASRSAVKAMAAIRDGEALNRPLRVAVIGGGPSGACAAETLAKGGVEVFLIERKMDNCKVGGGFMILRMDGPQLDLHTTITLNSAGQHGSMCSSLRSVQR